MPAAVKNKSSTTPLPDAKRAAMDATGTKFSIEIEHVASFRQLVDIVEDVLTTVDFRVSKHPVVEGTLLMSIDAIDPGNVCMVQSRLTCIGTIPSDLSFCVDTKTLNTCLRNIPRHHSLRIVQERNTTDIALVSFDGLSRKTDMCFELHTLDDASETMQLNALDYSYDLNLSMSSFRGLIKLAKGLQCEAMTLSVYTGGGGGESDVSTSVLEVSAKGKAAFRRTLVSAVSAQTDETGSTRAIQDVDEEAVAVDVRTMTRALSQSYILDYLCKFTKSMDQQTCNLKMGRDLPVLLHYDLGVSGCYVRFVLAPRVEEEE